ncbi:MAG: glycosyltransferase family 2 protein [Nostochopsis sp.]
MIVFVIPLKSAKVSTSWHLVSKLFERCIKSVCNQTSDEFRVIVVCQEKPNIDFSHPHITYIQVDYLLPNEQLKELNVEQDIESKRVEVFSKGIDCRSTEVFSKDIDKGRKLLTGLAYAEKFSPSHVMVVDADDVISKNIAKFVKQNANCNGWYLNKGYIYNENRQLLEIKFGDFNVMCGSTVIVKYHLYPLLFNNYDYVHGKIVLGNDIKLKALPLIGSIYSVGNGDNIFQTIERQNQRNKGLGILLKITTILRYRRLTKSIRDDFNFIPIHDW